MTIAPEANECSGKSTAKTARETLDETIDQLRSDLEDLREKRKVERYHWAEKERAFFKSMQQLHNRWTKCKGRVNIQLYTKVMEKEFGNMHLIPQKILTQQAHLCRSLHQMEVHEVALKLVDDQNRDIVKLMKKQIASIQEEESNVEVELMNQLCKLDAIVKTMQAVLGIVPDPKDDWQASLSQSLSRRGSVVEAPAAPVTSQGILETLKGLWSFGRRPPLINLPLRGEYNCDETPGKYEEPQLTPTKEEKESDRLSRRALTVALITQ